MTLVKNNYISMGKPIKSPFLIPVKHNSTPNCINEPFMVDGKIYRVTCVSFGTPHGVVFTDDVKNIDIEHVGASLEMHPLFPEGTSIVFVQALNRKQIKTRLWQRGQGEIPFTSEAVCVAMTAAKMLQKIETEAEVLMGDNKFNVLWNGADENVYLAEG